MIHAARAFAPFNVCDAAGNGDGSCALSLAPAHHHLLGARQAVVSLCSRAIQPRRRDTASWALGTWPPSQSPSTSSSSCACPAAPHVCTAPPFLAQLRLAAPHCIWSWRAKVAALWRGLKLCARQVSAELLHRLDWGQVPVRRRSEGQSERGVVGLAGCRTCW